ncbi:hypothetical protein GCM10008090_24490 [Arenicella chitinivorans]|uniref:DUF4785 family protein n=1 Tax=Arenicella chitinivorans TaxID=1329800 RepID=A0A918RV86_9GAMM|nr:DUF4785 domain-containing protein [Arenicella chitinivorans]GHA13826.1 hypothetical protein GCM10008090_24490 [Arenicella chitinivorans]
MKKSNLVLVACVLTISTSIQAAGELPVSRDKVQYSHLVDGTQKQSLKGNGASQESQVYYREVSGQELNQGVELATDADSAVVKLTALRKATSRNALPPLPLDLELYKGETQRSVADPSIQMKQTSEALRGAAPTLFKHSEVMKIPADMGRGRFKLKAKTPVQKDDRYLLYVLDHNSDIKLKVNSRKNAYAKGEKLDFNAHVTSARKVKTVGMKSVLVAPDGRRFPIKSMGQGSGIRGNWKLDIDTQRAPGELWQLEVESTVINDQQVETRRIAKVALDIHDATATVASIKTRKGHMVMGLNVQQKGRFEVRALVAGTARDGSLKPISLTYYADWLERGLQTVSFPIDKALFKESGLSAPYVVQSVQLLDQSRMAALDAREGKWLVD